MQVVRVTVTCEVDYHHAVAAAVAAAGAFVFAADDDFLDEREGDAGELFESAMTRAVTAFKMSWKRCIDVDKVRYFLGNTVLLVDSK